MCEQSSAIYNHGDVVWVKLGPCWWPGEIVSFEELPSDIAASFKKSPLAIVKFFDEEKYEFVRQSANIETYNCNRKYDFIKKGLDLYRAKHAFMGKFQEDVITAETKTEGDPNVLEDPRLEPEKKPNYASIFGSPVAKKGRKVSPSSRGRGRTSIGKLHSSPTSKKMYSLITHPRFLGKDDSEIRILVQSPTATPAPQTEYECYTCGFKSSRVEVIVFHNKSHFRSATAPSSPPKKMKKSPGKRPKKRRLPTSKTETIDEDLELLRQGLPVCSDHTSSDEEDSTDDTDEEPLSKRKAKAITSTKSKSDKSSPVPEVKKDIRTDLLAEWDDDDEEEEEQNQSIAERMSPKVVSQSEESNKNTEISKATEQKSCFDFDEEDDDLLTTLEGGKIPRIIPPSEKRKSLQDLEKECTSSRSQSISPKEKTEDNIIESETDKMKISSDKGKHGKAKEEIITKKRESQFQMEFEAFNNALKETTVPKILDIPQLHKYEQNFHNTKTIKFPDKSEDESSISPIPSSSSTVATTIGDMSSKNEKSKSLESINSSNKIEVSTEPIPPPIKELVQKNTEVATKLTNPKKRFVKTFEDETKNSTKEESPIPQESKKEPSPEPLKNEVKSLEVAKLKTQLMKKLGDASPTKESPNLAEKPRKGSYQKNRKYKIFAEITQIEPAESKDHKRSITESTSDKDINTIAKKKRYSSTKEDKKEEKMDSLDEILSVIKEPPLADITKETLQSHVPSTEVETANQFAYLNTSPSKIYSDLHVDRDEFLGTNTLSESQKLTIQNIIGVASPMVSVQQPTNETSDKENETKVIEVHPEVLGKSNEDIAEKQNESEISTEENVEAPREATTVLEPEDVPKSNVPVTDQPLLKETEDKVDHITSNNQILGITEKLNDTICEKLPDEIIETRNQTADEESNKILDLKTTTDTPEQLIKDYFDQEIIVSEKTLVEKDKSVTEEIIEEKVERKPSKTKRSRKTKDRRKKRTRDRTDKKTKKELEPEKSKTPEKAERGNIEVTSEEIIVTEDNSETGEKSNLDQTEIEKVPEEKPEQKENADDPIIETPVKLQEENLEETKEDTELDNLTIEKQDESIKEESLILSSPKKDLNLHIEPIGKTTTDLVKSMLQEEEMVTIEGNLTVVTESDLADKQVEIATTPEVSKPITLTSFSMDFCEDVETYVKGETIMQNFPKLKTDSSLTVEEEKTSLKDNLQMQMPVRDTEPNNITQIEEEKIVSQEEIIKEMEPIKSDENKIIETSTKVDSVDDSTVDNDSKTTLKNFDDIAPAKEEPPLVIMEGVEETVKNVIEQISLINETILETTLQIEDTKKGDAKSENKEQNTQEIIKEISEKEEIIIPPIDISVESEVAKITDSIAEQELVIQDNHQNTTSTKLLEILTDKPRSTAGKIVPVIPAATQVEVPVTTSFKSTYRHTKLISKKSIPGTSKASKPNILSDKLIKPLDESKTVSVKKVTSKRSYQDVEDIDAYIIQKPLKKINVSVEEASPPPKPVKKAPVISKGKARILQQTIITPTGDILQPPVSQPQTDDNMFDINSMPIVLSDQILTPESIENMQIVLQENTTTKQHISPIKKPPVAQQQVKLLNKTQTPVSIGIKETILKSPLAKPSPTAKQKVQKVYGASGATSSSTTTTKILKHNTQVIAQPGKQGNFIIVPASTTATGSKYTVGKRPAIVKRTPQKITSPISKMPDMPVTSSGNKIMILKSQGQQQKILLTTPQKPTPRIRSRAIQKQIITKESPQQKGANIISQTIVNSKGQITTLASPSVTGARGHIVASMAQQNRQIKIDPAKMKRLPQQRMSVSDLIKPGTSGQQRTIIIKNPQGQTVKKIQGTDDALLDQQVAEQLQAISRASASQQLKDLSSRTPVKLAKKPYIKKPEMIKTPVTKSIIQTAQTSNKNVSVPPLAPISPAKKVETHYVESNELSKLEEKSDEIKRPPHQLVIQDAQGNQTTITEGQILALPSEAIDGQPHSYVLVTLDETGNLTPLNSEALMSLDPNLNLTNDLGNMVLQIDQGTAQETETQPVETPQRAATEEVETTPKESILLKESADKPAAVENVLLSETPSTEASDQNVQAVINSGEMGQLIITGDAVTAQKFLESLAEGNADLANLLANAEGNVLIQADGQQILINTDSENPMLVMNPESISNETSEGSGNPVFASQPVKNQDILAAALADTDVFQQDQSISHSPSKVAQSQLSPSSALYPMNVGNVLETNSMNSPIMTPLEVPSTNSKKIDNENEILTQVPKNVDLPITITDPNISQTVSQQQVVSLMASELQTNLDLPLAIQDPGLSVTSAEMSSPSFVYSLPALDDTVDINQKAFSGSISMPLLTEEPEETVAVSSSGTNEEESEEMKVTVKKNTEENVAKASKEEPIDDANTSDSKDDKKTDFIDSEGLCAMRGGICNSLSEPPPDMFDFSVENQPYETVVPQTAHMDIPLDSTPSSEVSNTINDRENSLSSVEERKTDDVPLYTVNTTSPSTNTDDSCEIPVQPPIIAKPFEENGTSDARFDEEDKLVTDRDV